MIHWAEIVAKYRKPLERALALWPHLRRVAWVMGAALVCSNVLNWIMVNSVLQGAFRHQSVQSLRTESAGAVTLAMPNYRSLEKAILERNVFNSSGEVPDEPDPMQGGEGGSSVFDLNAPCRKTRLNIDLLGTIYLGPSTSLATVREKGYDESDVYRVGDTIVGNEQAKVAAIERARLIINNGGVKECIELAAIPPGVEVGTSASPKVPPPPVTAPGDGATVNLDPAFVESELGPGFSTIISRARTVPNAVDGGGVNGYKVFAIQPGSLFDRVGIKNDDVITRINDTVLRAEHGVFIYQAFQDERELTIHILRHGTEPRTINVRIAAPAKGVTE